MCNGVNNAGSLDGVPAKDVPAWLAFEESNRYNKTQKKSNQLSWKKQVNNDLKQIHKELSLGNTNIRQLAEKRDWWKEAIVERSITVAVNPA